MASDNEFPAGYFDTAADGVSRRVFLKLMAASMAMAGAGGCTRKQPIEEIVPYVDPPENLVAGRPLYYATTFPLRGFGRGIVVEQHEGRPTKIEGNPRHPSSLGATDAITQAAVLQMYDPDRSSAILHQNTQSSQTIFLSAFRDATVNSKKRVRVLSGTCTSPTLAQQIDILRQTFSELQWHQHDPLARDGVYEGTALAFGKPLLPVYHFGAASRVLSLDANFLAEEAGAVRYAREFAGRRRHAIRPAEGDEHKAFTPPPLTAESMLRLYVAESTATITGAVADHRLPMAASRGAALLRQVARALSKQPGGEGGEFGAFAEAVAADLGAHPGTALIVPGDGQPAAVHALAHLLNVQLQAVGKTVDFIEPPTVHPPITGNSLGELVRALDGGEVDILLILDVNAAYNAPGDVDFAGALKRFTGGGGISIHHGLYQDETAKLCAWHLPASHFLESWGDCRGHDGTASLMQPLIAPLYQSQSTAEFLAALVSQRLITGKDLLRAHWFGEWKELADDAARETLWQESLKNGVIAKSAAAAVTPTAATTIDALLQKLPAESPSGAASLELNFRPDPALGDGDFANNAWLQELPKPLSQLTWDNAAIVSPATARGLGVKEGDRVQVDTGSAAAVLPVLLQVGQPERVVTVHLGFGRTDAGAVADGVGANVYPLRRTDHLWTSSSVRLRPQGTGHVFARAQVNMVMSDRDVARARPIASAEKPRETERRLSLYRAYQYTGYKWGMVVDLSACIGCSACVIACQSENNIPVVGKEQVRRGRDMHWMRIDTYFAEASTRSLAAAGANPEVHLQPMMCQHCENAPCEVVCPVGATTHSAEGINEMTYNRCVGTRYCSNNCPYKVRRFNFFMYNDHEHPTLDMQKNPEVTVRARGVMEKCTYCVQRINRARIEAKKLWVENDARNLPTKLRRANPDSPDKPETLPAISVVTACQQACPTEAIIFGDLNDGDSDVARLNGEGPWKSLNYGVLTDLNTEPRTRYLERLRNRNPALEEGV